MRQLVLPPMRLKRATLDSAFDAVFGPAMLRRVHGPTTRVGDFVNGKRTFHFRVKVDTVPRVIQRFFSNAEMGVTTTQHVSKSETKWVVTNNICMHFVGSQLFSLEPMFFVEAMGDGFVLGGTVRHRASLPPPLKGIAEAFLMRNTERELSHFCACLAEAGVIE